MLEQIIITSLSTAGVLHLMQKWQIKNPLSCDFCFAFWASFFCFLLTNFVSSDLVNIAKCLYNQFIYALSSAVLSFYISIRINMYANNR